MIRARLVRRLKRTAVAGRATLLLRQAQAAVSPTARKESRRTNLPGRYRWLRIGTIGPLNGPEDRLTIRDVLSDRSSTKLDVVLIPGVTAGGPAELTPDVTDALIECERHSTPTVLLATDPADLDVPVAALCRDMASSDRAAVEKARAQMGAARTHQLPPLDAGAAAWLDRLMEGI
jgi:hypothetical protein